MVPVTGISPAGHAAVKLRSLCAAILVGARAAQPHPGDAGVYLGSLVPGMAGVDAITPSLARLSAGGAVAIGPAARANITVKGGTVLALGSPPSRRTILPCLPVTLAVGLDFVI